MHNQFIVESGYDEMYILILQNKKLFVINFWKTER